MPKALYEYCVEIFCTTCANAVLGNKREAIEDLQIAIEKSPQLRDEIDGEVLFENIKESEEFKKISS